MKRKKFIKFIECSDDYQQQKTRQELNDLGFYALSLPESMLEVYALEEEQNWLQRLIKRAWDGEAYN